MTNNETSAPDSTLTENEGVSLDFSALPMVAAIVESTIPTGMGFSTPYPASDADIVNQKEGMTTSSGYGTGGEGTVTLNAGDVFDLASLGHTLFITGDDSPDSTHDFLALTQAWNSGGTVTEGGVTFHSYMATVAGQTVTLNVEQGLGIALNQQDG